MGGVDPLILEILHHIVPKLVGRHTTAKAHLAAQPGQAYGNIGRGAAYILVKVRRLGQRLIHIRGVKINGNAADGDKIQRFGSVKFNVLHSSLSINLCAGDRFMPCRLCRKSKCGGGRSYTPPAPLPLADRSNRRWHRRRKRPAPSAPRCQKWPWQC